MRKSILAYICTSLVLIATVQPISDVCSENDNKGNSLSHNVLEYINTDEVMKLFN